MILTRIKKRLALLWYRRRYSQLLQRGWSSARCAAHRVADSDTRRAFGPAIWD